MNGKESSPRFLSVSAAAKILDVSAVTLYREISRGEFPAVKIRGRYVVPAKALDEMEEAALAQASVASLTSRGLPE